jgi:hypothetical protein
MGDLVIGLFKYFARFVEKDVLKGVFVQPNQSRRAGYSEIETEVMLQADGDVIPAVRRYIVSLNRNFVSECIKNVKGFILFVEYGPMSVDHDVNQGVQELLSVTVAFPFSDSNNDSVNEILLMNEGLEILDRIVRTMMRDQSELGFCSGRRLVSFPVEIDTVDPFKFHGCGGWRAVFSGVYTIV